MKDFVDLFESQVIDGELTLDEFLDQTATTIGDLLQYSDRDMFEMRLHRFISYMYNGKIKRVYEEEAGIDRPYQREAS